MVVLLLTKEVHNPDHLPCDDVDTVHLPVGSHDDLQVLAVRCGDLNVDPLLAGDVPVPISSTPVVSRRPL